MAWYFNFYLKRVVVTLACSGPALGLHWYGRYRCRRWTPSKESRRSWNVTHPSPPPPLPTALSTYTHTPVPFSTPPVDHCQITICIMICSAQKGKLTPKFYGSAGCNNQCFIGYTKEKYLQQSWRRKLLSLPLQTSPFHQFNPLYFIGSTAYQKHDLQEFAKNKWMK